MGWRGIIVGVVTSAALVAPSAAFAASATSSWEPATGTLTWTLEGGLSSGYLLDQTATEPVPCSFEGCPPSWDVVKHLVIRGVNQPLEIVTTTGEPWVRADGTGIDIRIEAASIAGRPDVVLTIKHVERDGSASKRALRTRVVGKQIDFDSDGKVDLDVVARDWKLWGFPGSPANDVIDLRRMDRQTDDAPEGVSWGKAYATVGSGAGNDIIYGSPFDDDLGGGDGSDRIYGGAGNDRITGGLGRDYLYGGAGNDQIRGLYMGSGARRDPSGDFIWGGSGYNALYGSPGVDRIYGGPNRDWVHGFEGNDLIYGGRGPDVLTGGKGRDRLYGGAGDDELVDHEGTRNLAFGGPGKDYINFGTLNGPWKRSARTSIANCGPGARDFTPERYPHRVGCERVV